MSYRQCRYISRQPWLQPSDHVLVSFFAQLAFWHFSAVTESSAVHEPYPAWESGLGGPGERVEKAPRGPAAAAAAA